MHLFSIVQQLESLKTQKTQIYLSGLRIHKDNVIYNCLACTSRLIEALMRNSGFHFQNLMEKIGSQDCQTNAKL